jgi:glycosyltransferase involved in cell wall biosynthesis
MVGFFGRIAPEKGLHVLAEAYRIARQSGDLPEARLEVAGYMAPDCKPYLDEIQKSLRDAGLAGEFHYRGVLERADKIAFLRGLDVMSMPATYDEPKGVSLLEAMACGVPLVQPRRGAFTEIVERTGGGLLVQPDDPQNLAEGILKIARDSTLADDLSSNAFRGVREHYTAAHMADKVLESYNAAIENPSPSVLIRG